MTEGAVPVRGLILAFVLGAAGLQTRADLPALSWVWLGLPVLALLPLLPGTSLGRHVRVGLALILALAAGFFYAAWRAEVRLAEALPLAWEGRAQAVVGRIIGLPESTPRGVRFMLEPERLPGRSAGLPGRLQLSMIAPPGQPVPRLRGGDCLRLNARLYRPHGSLNPAGFDYEAWLLERGVRATGYLIGAPALADQCDGQARAGLDRARERLRQRLSDALAGAEHAGIVIALAVGDQNAIPDAQWTLFRRTGVTHLMSISGLHVTLFSSLVFWVAQWLWRRVPFLAGRYAARPAAAMLGLGSAAAYVALAGFGLPAQRTLYMLAAVALALASGRLHSPSRVLAAALAAVVLIDPWAALSPGFWLSFGAVAALFLAGWGRLGRLRLWRAWVSAQWAATLALLPALLMLFHEVSLVAPLANAFAIPAISLLAVPLILLGALLPGDGLLHAAHAVIDATLLGLQALAALPQPVFHAAMPSIPAVALAGLGVVALLMPRGVPGRWLGLLLFLPLLLPRVERPAPGEAWVTLLDVGQGLAVVVRTATRDLLYDAGPRYASGEDAGQRVVAPYLHAHGVNRLDALVISHDDVDHSGGAMSLIASHAPAWLLTSLAGQQDPPSSAMGAQILASGAVVRVCAAGQHWSWDGVRFEVMHPPAHQYRIDNYTDNDRSCVLRVDAGGRRLLLTGDIARLAELSLLERQAPEKLRADIMLVPHHGSASSSQPALLDAVAPEIALVSVGQRNGYGHPAAEVLERYRQAGAQVLRTDRMGAIELRLAGGRIDIRRAREDGRRYWHGH